MLAIVFFPMKKPSWHTYQAPSLVARWDYTRIIVCCAVLNLINIFLKSKVKSGIRNIAVNKLDS